MSNDPTTVIITPSLVFQQQDSVPRRPEVAIDVCEADTLCAAHC